jgi:hypothetical protein
MKMKLRDRIRLWWAGFVDWLERGLVVLMSGK